MSQKTYHQLDDKCLPGLRRSLRTKVFRTKRMILCPVVLLAVIRLSRTQAQHTPFSWTCPNQGSLITRIQCTIFTAQVDLALRNDKRPDHRHVPLELEPSKEVDACKQLHLDAVQWVQSNGNDSSRRSVERFSVHDPGRNIQKTTRSDCRSHSAFSHIRKCPSAHHFAFTVVDGIAVCDRSRLHGRWRNKPLQLPS